MTIKSDTVTGVAHWASYLVNGDASGLDDVEKHLCDIWADSLAPWYVVATGDAEPWFTWQGGLYGADCAGVTVCEYVVHCVEGE